MGFGAWAGIGCAEPVPVNVVPCEEQEDVIDPVAPTLLGFSVTDILGYALGTHRSALEWSQLSDAGKVTFERHPPASVSALELSLAAGTRPPVFVTSTLRGGVAPELDERSCPDHVKIPVQATVRSDDGALAEAYEAELIAVTPHMAHLRQSGLAEDVVGGLALSNFEIRDEDVDGELDPANVVQEWTVSRLGVNGILATDLNVWDDDFLELSGTILLGSAPGWPEAPVDRDCVRWGAITHDATASLNGTSFGNVASVVAQHPTWSMRFPDGASSPVSVSLDHLGGPICFREVHESEGNAPLVLEAGVVARFHAADNSLLAAVPVRVVVDFDSVGSASKISVRASADDNAVDLVTFSTLVSARGLDTSQFARAGVEIDAEFNLLPNPNVAVDGLASLPQGRGKFVVLGYRGDSRRGAGLLSLDWTSE